MSRGNRTWFVTEDSELLVRPLHPAAADLPVPATEMGKGLCLSQELGLFLKRGLGVLALQFRSNAWGEYVEKRL